MERDIIIVIEGGAMLGVFGAGVVTAFQEASIYGRVHSVYGASAGAHDLAYFLAAQEDSRQVPTGASIYYEDLIERHFIKPGRFFSFLWDIAVRQFRRDRPIRHLLDLDFLSEVERTTKKLDIGAIVRQPIPFYVAVYDVEKREVAFIDGKQDTLATLKASSSAPPFYADTVTLRGRKYLDGGLIQNWDVNKIVQGHPDKRIMYIINNRKSAWFTVLALPYYFFEAVLNTMCFGWRIGWARLKHSFSYATEKKLRRFPNVTVVSNTLQMTNSITDKKKLLKIYEHGLEMGKKALQEVGLA